MTTVKSLVPPFLLCGQRATMTTDEFFLGAFLGSKETFLLLLTERWG